MNSFPLSARILIVLSALVIAGAVTTIIYLRAYLFHVDERHLNGVLHLIIDDESHYFGGGWTSLS